MPRAKTTLATAHAAHATSTLLLHVHETSESVASIELTPPHPPREDTPEYQQTHKLLVFEKDTPCEVCRIRHSDLQDPARANDPTINKFGAKAVESHHFPIERSLGDAVDWRKVHDVFPEVYSQASLLLWLDSPRNMKILCDVHHRSTSRGIHHLLTQDYEVQRYLLDGYIIAASARDATAAAAADERIEVQTGIEALVDGGAPATSTSDPQAVASVVNAPAVTEGTPPPTSAKPTRRRSASSSSSTSKKPRTRKAATATTPSGEGSAA